MTDATVTIEPVHVGPMDNVAYVVTCGRTQRVLVVDAADEPRKILATVGDDTSRVDAVVTTHQHRDHVQALGAVVEETGATTYAGEPDASAVTAATGVPIDVGLRHGSVVDVGELRFTVVALRGHTPGSVALALATTDGTHLFTGDSLFPGGVGATGGDPDRFEALISDVENRIFARYGDDVVVHPGHGAPTTLGRERPALASWRERGW
ncbi:MBL fold metallo-hydrolase [Paraoerskovia marina]|uniref:MBL fold metallo-hydrolase n=1 Tax=Paraoerskovia marina TaxID=545619 RepID=UPI0004927CFE|nr:MBL fold metallo-hydrolase [Paraoerskovia marina]